MESENETQTGKKQNQNKIEIVPAILPDHFHHLEEEIELVHHHVDTVQIDVTDGNFAPSKTWPYKNPDEEHWQNLISQEEGLPHWEDLNFEIDLMVKDQLVAAREWISAGAFRIIAHIESMKDESFEEFRALKTDFDVELVLALSPSTPNSVLDDHLDYIDAVQFMGNDKIGYHGVELDEKVLEKITELRAKMPDLTIGIDIGVTLETIPRLAAAGVTRFSSGSLILNSQNPKETIEQMRELAG